MNFDCKISHPFMKKGRRKPLFHSLEKQISLVNFFHRVKQRIV